MTAETTEEEYIKDYLRKDINSKMTSVYGNAMLNIQGHPKGLECVVYQGSNRQWAFTSLTWPDLVMTLDRKLRLWEELRK